MSIGELILWIAIVGGTVLVVADYTNIMDVGGILFG